MSTTPATMAAHTRDIVDQLRQLSVAVATTVDPIASLGIRRAIGELEDVADLLEDR